MIEYSSPEQSVQGRIVAREAWWFNNLQLSPLVIGVLLNCYMINDNLIRCFTPTLLP